MNIKKFVTLVGVPLVALLVGAAVTCTTQKIVPYSADGSPITVSGDTIHFLHREITITNSYNAIAHHHSNQPVSLTMLGCTPPSNCSVNLMANWSAKLSGGTLVNGQITGVTDVADFTDVPGGDNTVTIQANRMYPLARSTSGVDQGGNDFYFTAIAVTSGGQTTNLSCQTIGSTCSIVMAYCPPGLKPVLGNPTYCQR